MRTFLPLAFIVSICASSCQMPEATPEETSVVAVDPAVLKQQIQGLEDTLSMAYNTKDLDLFTRFYAEDAVTYGEGREQLFGRKAMVDHFRRTVLEDSIVRNFSYLTIDVFHEGDLAVETGKWIQKDPAGAEKDHGFYMVVFKKENNQWVSIRDIWNSSTIVAAKPAE